MGEARPSVDVRVHSWPGPTVDVRVHSWPATARPTVDARPTTVGPGHPQSAWVASWPRTAKHRSAPRKCSRRGYRGPDAKGQRRYDPVDPAHAGIKGNEAASIWAKAAAGDTLYSVSKAFLSETSPVRVS